MTQKILFNSTFSIMVGPFLEFGAQLQRLVRVQGSCRGR
jgi:hypothetical protein